MTDVAFKFAGQVLDRGEDAAGDDLALDPGKPVFDLVEPGGVGRREVEMYFGVSREEVLNPHSLMGREIVGNEMDLLAARLVGDYLGEEGHELLAGVARGGFAHDLAIARVKRSVQRKGAVAIVFRRGTPCRIPSVFWITLTTRARQFVVQRSGFERSVPISKLADDTCGLNRRTGLQVEDWISCSSRVFMGSARDAMKWNGRSTAAKLHSAKRIDCAPPLVELGILVAHEDDASR